MSNAAALSLLPPIRHTLGEGVAASLREAIFRGGLTPEQRLSEAQIADMLNVSRAPVRDAFAQLEGEGLLVRPDGRGIAVRLLSHQDADEICSLRLALESLALRRAIHRLTAEELDQLAGTIDQTKQADGPDQLALVDLQFHELIVRAARHERLLASWLTLRSQLRLLLMQHNRADCSTVRGTVRSHAELLKAIRGRDEPRALALLDQQLSDQYTWFVSTFPQPPAEGQSAPRPVRKGRA